MPSFKKNGQHFPSFPITNEGKKKNGHHFASPPPSGMDAAPRQTKAEMLRNVEKLLPGALHRLQESTNSRVEKASAGLLKSSGAVQLKVSEGGIRQSNSHVPQAPQAPMSLRSSQASCVTALLHQTMEPGTAPLLRVPVVGFMPTVGTALARTVDTYSRDFHDYTLIDPAETSAITDKNGVFELQSDLGVEPLILLRDPVVSHIQRNIRPVGSANGVYQLLTGGEGQTITVNLPFVSSPLTLCPGATINVPFTNMVHLSGWKPYGDITPCGTAGNSRVFWIDTRANGAGPSIITIDLETATANNYRLNAVLFRHFDDDRKEVSNGANLEAIIAPISTAAKATLGASFQGQLDVFSTGYYSIDIVADERADTAANQYEQASITVTVDVKSSTAFQHVSSDAMEGKEDIISNLRVNGSSALVQNTSAEQARGGTVYAAQLTGDKKWYEMIEDVRSVSNTNVVSRYVGDWSKGFYGYVKPQGHAPMELETVWETNDDEVSHTHIPQFKPFRQLGTVVILVQPPAPLGGTFSPTQYTLHVIRSLEFTTNDQFFDVERSICQASDYDEYVRDLSGMPQFFENPLHLAAIGALIRGVAATARYYGPTAIRAIKAMIVAKELYDKRRR